MSAGPPRLILHVGLPKTGTTFLQHQIFAQAPAVAYLHRSRSGAEAEICRRLRDFGRAGALAAPVRRAGLVRRLDALLQARPAGAGPAAVLISDENISVLADGFWEGAGASPERLAARLGSLARRLDGRFAAVRVVVGVRRQDRWLASRYAESSRYFADFGQADFDRRMARIAAGEALQGPLGWLDYDRVERAFAAALGAQNVALLPLERVAEAPEPVFGDLGAFLGADLGPAVRRALRTGAMRPRNQLSEGAERWRLRRDDSVIGYAPGLRAALMERFAEANRALDARTPLGFA